MFALPWLGVSLDHFVPFMNTAGDTITIWQSLSETTPVLFNRGMAALFTGRPADARADLNRAVDQISDDSGWHHLGKLYLAVAEMRGA